MARYSFALSMSFRRSAIPISGVTEGGTAAGVGVVVRRVTIPEFPSCGCVFERPLSVGRPRFYSTSIRHPVTRKLEKIEV